MDMPFLPKRSGRPASGGLATSRIAPPVVGSSWSDPTRSACRPNPTACREFHSLGATVGYTHPVMSDIGEDISAAFAFARSNEVLEHGKVFIRDAWIDLHAARFVASVQRDAHHARPRFAGDFQLREFGL